MSPHPRPRAYVASSFSQAHRIPAVAAVLEQAEWDIIDCWWKKDEKDSLPSNPDDFYASPTTKAIAARHWRAIQDCDALVLVADLEHYTRFTGAAVEFGYAHALGKPLVVYGLAKRSAMWSPAIHVATPTGLLAVMRDLNYHNPRGED